VEGVDYDNQTITHIWEVHFYYNKSYYDIYFVDTPSSGNQYGGTTAISNGSSYVLTFSPTESTGLRINSGATESTAISGGGGYVSNITNTQQTNSILLDSVSMTQSVKKSLSLLFFIFIIFVFNLHDIVCNSYI
jgi:hypothetical protein